MKWFRGGLVVFKAQRLCVSLNSRLESSKEERRKDTLTEADQGSSEWMILAGEGAPSASYLDRVLEVL